MLPRAAESTGLLLFSSRGQERVNRLGYTNYLNHPKNYDKEKNPEGLINLGTAENSLLSEKLLEVL